MGGTSGLMSKRLVSGHSPSPAAQQETRRGWGGGAGMGGAAGQRAGTPGRPDSTSSPVPPGTGRAVSARGASVVGVQLHHLQDPPDALHGWSQASLALHKRIPELPIISRARASSCQAVGTTWFFSSCGGILEL